MQTPSQVRLPPWRCKGGTGSGWGQDFASTLTDAVRAAATARRRMRFTPATAATAPAAAPPPATAARPAVAAPAATHIRRGSCVVIGASTGGTEALAAMVARMPANFPPTFIVQHMPPLYTRSFAQRLDTLGAVRVREASDGDVIGPGQVLVAPGGRQLHMGAGHAGPRAIVRDEPPVNRHAPSVDVLFRSAHASYRSRVYAVLLTGMGNDGAQGLLEIRRGGGRTIAQDEATSVVYGMPQEAAKLGAAETVLPLGDIVPQLLRWLADA